MKLAAITRSLRFKVMAVILATTLAALLVSSVALLIYEYQTYRDLAVSDAHTQAEIIARTSAPTLAFNDPAAAVTILALLETRRWMNAAAIYTSQGDIFATYVRGNAALEFPALSSRDGARLSGENLELFHPIIEDGEMLGTVYLQGRHDLMERLRDNVMILGVVMLLSLLAAAIVSLRLQRSVTGPVLAVTSVARKVVEDRDFTLRARKTTGDEIGLLVDSFNSMLGEIGQRTEAVEASNRQLREESEERRKAEAALRDADRRKDEFLATLAHELRNPLAPMVNALSLLAHVPATDVAARERAEQIMHRQLSHMVRLVDDLLDVSRITTDKLALRTEPVQLSAIVENAIDTVQPAFEARQQELTVEMPDDPVFLMADPVRLAQVLSNLFNNSVRHTPPGGTISLKATVTGNRTRIVIADNGAGISAEMLPRVFDMFTQGDSSVEREHSGLGVGLALSKRLVELHGGAIEASSSGIGAGSTFAIELPVMEGSADLPPGTGQLAERGQPADGHRILLVDDNVDFATSLAMLLGGMGHEVRVAHEAASALTVAAELRPEVAFLDIGLPGTSGYELARRMREQPELADTLLIALSGWGQDADVQRSRAAGFVQHLVKPVDVATIQTVLAGLGREQRV